MISVDHGLSGDGGETDDEAQRRDTRDSLFVLAGIRPEGRDAFERVRVRNVSSGGLMAETRETYAACDRIELLLEGLGTVAGSVAWAEAGRIGVAFDHPIDKSRARKPATAAQTDRELFRPAPATLKRPPLRG